MTPQSNAIISKLSESGQTITPADDDIRGLTVKDKDGKKLGKVHDLLIDAEARKVRFMLVEHGGFLGFGDTKSFIPVDDITKITADDVFINHTAEHVAAAPPYDPHLDADREYHNSVYGHYGYIPFWGLGYVYPGAYYGGLGLVVV